MKKLLFLLSVGFLSLPILVGASLYNYYQEQGMPLPSIQDRKEIANICSIYDYAGKYEQNVVLEMCLRDGQMTLGSTLPIAGSTYNLAGSGISGSATSIILQSLTLPQTGQKIIDSDLSPTFYITLEPGNRSKQEIASCTTVTQGASSATLSGCSRGLSPLTPYTASTTLQFAHAGGSQVIFSDPPQLFNLFPALDDTETITGQWLFNILPESSVAPTTTNQFANKAYVDNSINQGAATSTESVGGISELATQIEAASTTASTADKPLVLQAQHVTSTPSANVGLHIPMAENDGKLNINWFDLTEVWAWTGAGSISTPRATTTEFFEVTGRTKLAEATTTGTMNVAELGFDGGDVMSKWPFMNLYASSSDFIIAASRYYWHTYTVPAMGTNDRLEVKGSFNINGNGSNCPNIYARFNSATTTLFNSDIAAAGEREYVFNLVYQNMGRTANNLITTATSSNGAGTAQVAMNGMIATSTTETNSNFVFDISSVAAAGTCYIYNNSVSLDIIRNYFHP